MTAPNRSLSGPFPYEELKERFPDLLRTLLGEPVSPNAPEWRWGKNENFSAVVSGEKAGSWFDHKADQGGGPIELIKQQKSMDHGEALDWARDWLGRDICHVVPPPGPGTSSGKKQDTTEKARRLWAESVPVAGTEGETYFRGRGITKGFETVRFLHQFWYETKKSLPAVIIRATSGAVQVTVIRDGKKAPIPRPKRSYGPISGSWVQLQEGTGPALIGEGLENVLSAISAGFNGPALVSLGISNLAKCATSCPYGSLLLLGDGNALNSPARDGFVKALATASRSGKEVRPIDLAPGGGDLNDILRDSSRGPAEVSRLVREALASEPWRTTGPDPAAASESPTTPPAEFEQRDGFLYLMKTDNGNRVPIQLANFTALIVAQTEELNGVESRRTYEIEAIHKGQTRRVRVAAEAFSGMKWKDTHLSATAFVRPGQGNLDRMAYAIRTLSGEIPEKQVYTCTGWVQHGGRRLYLTEASAIGAGGLVSDVEVVLPDKFKTYHLPEPPTGASLNVAVEASLSILEVAPPTVTFPLLGSIYRAVLGDAGYTPWVSGRATVGKTALTLVGLQHWGAGFTSRTVPEDWSSTAAALQESAFLIKDAVLIIDDYAPQPSRQENEKQREKVHKLVRAQANGSGRGRCNVDGSLRAGHPPRGLIISTGEDVPGGDWIMARILLVEVRKGDIDFKKLTILQQMAGKGILAQALAAFVQWLANHPEWMGERRNAREVELRERFTGGGQNGRSPNNLAAALLGFEVFLQFATDVGVLTREQASDLLRRAGLAFERAATTQAEQSRDTDPVRRYMAAIVSALSTGEAYLENRDGGAPLNWAAAGWRPDSINPEVKRPSGGRIGWTDAAGVYLEPSAAYRLANDILTREGMPLGIGRKTMHSRLEEAGGILVRRDESRQTATVRKMIAGQRTEVLHLTLQSLFPPDNGSLDADGQKKTDQWSEFPGVTDHANLTRKSKDRQSGQIGQINSPPIDSPDTGEGVNDDDVPV